MTPSRPRDKRKVGEFAGGTAAECAAICCCCPFMLTEFITFAVYKLPAGICRRIWTKRLLRKKKKIGLLEQHGGSGSDRSSTIHWFDDLSVADAGNLETAKVSVDGSAEAVDLDKEMWERFHNAGFWRSTSQRHA